MAGFVSSVLAVVMIVILLLVFCGCGVSKDLTIPQEPTIWIVSEIYVPTRSEFKGMVGYKIIPVNPGSINAKPTWKLDYPGKYYVGQRLDFAPVEADGKGVQ